MANRIVIIGGGFCGAVLAANLLRRAPDRTEIVLIERGPEIGRGLAYARSDYPHLLNVPAGRLSADASDPLQFLHFAQTTLPEAGAEDFLPRQLYGAYLQEFLNRAERESRGVTLTRVYGEVTRISRHAVHGLLEAGFPDRAPITAARIVLAVGNPPPPAMPWADPVRDHPAYHDNPWVSPMPFRDKDSVLIIGNGLTMADVVASVCDGAAPMPRVMTISRRGLVPLPQSTFHAAAIRGDGAGLLERAHSMRQLLAASRSMAREVAGLGGDWREVVTFIRNLAPLLWQRLPEPERRRFVRHAQGHWDIHRHRLPPQLAGRIDSLRRSGRLAINAGRIEALTPAGERLKVTWRPRGSAVANTVVVDAVINAMGPDYSLRRSRDPLLQHLRRDGWICEDALNLGLRTGPLGACVGVDGSESGQLYYLGPMLRAHHWEATAAAELRNHAERLAQHLAPAGA
jgi:uncharacterized NAD(P)/FAD-binding protein YdhS